MLPYSFKWLSEVDSIGLFLNQRNRETLGNVPELYSHLVLRSMI